MRSNALVLAMVGLLGPGCTQLATHSAEAPAGCSVQIPEGQHWPGARWVGACRNAGADGLGVIVIREAKPTKPTPAGCPHQGVFYGETSLGQLSIGVIDTGDGYMPGRFSAGAPIEREDRNEIIRAFRVASRAALTASERFREKGDAACARRYAGKADHLANQMD